MWKVVPEGRVWVLWLRLRLGSGEGIEFVEFVS